MMQRYLFWGLLALLLMPHLDARGEVSKEQLLVMDLNHSEDVKPDVARTLTDLVTARFSEQQKLTTLSGQDIRKLLEMEGQKQALGCEDGESCLEEIAGAMGARFVVYGRISRLGDVLVLQLNLFDAQSGIPILRKVLEADDLGAFTKLLTPAVEELAAAVLKNIAPPAKSSHEEQKTEPDPDAKKPDGASADAEQSESNSKESTVPASNQDRPASGATLDTESNTESQNQWSWTPWLIVGSGGGGMVLGVVVGVVGMFPYVLSQIAAENMRSASERAEDSSLDTAEFQQERAAYDEAKEQYEFWGRFHNTIGLTMIAGGAVSTMVSVAVVGGGSAWLLLSGDEE